MFAQLGAEAPGGIKIEEQVQFGPIAAPYEGTQNTVLYLVGAAVVAYFIYQAMSE